MDFTKPENSQNSQNQQQEGQQEGSRMLVSVLWPASTVAAPFKFLASPFVARRPGSRSCACRRAITAPRRRTVAEAHARGRGALIRRGFCRSARRNAFRGCVVQWWAAYAHLMAVRAATDKHFTSAQHHCMQAWQRCARATVDWSAVTVLDSRRWRRPPEPRRRPTSTSG